MNSKLYIFLIPILAIVCSCAAFKYKPPYAYLNHEQHEKTVVEHSMDCFTCHRVDINEPDMNKRTEMLRAMLQEADDKRFISGTCHMCHVDRLTRVSDATSRCIVCHDSLKHIIPDDHKGPWIAEHGTPAKESGHSGSYRLPESVVTVSVTKPTAAQYAGSCDDCHEQWFCTNCHNVRESGMLNMHTRTYKLAHVAAAVADPASCNSCHTAKYCRDCHSSY